jgi:hypothetical protein
MEHDSQGGSPHSPPRKSRAAAAVGGAQPLPTFDVLVVEDNAANAKLMIALLKRLGFDNAALAPSGEAALELLARKSYDREDHLHSADNAFVRTIFFLQLWTGDPRHSYAWWHRRLRVRTTCSRAVWT